MFPYGSRIRMRNTNPDYNSIYAFARKDNRYRTVGRGYLHLHMEGRGLRWSRAPRAQYRGPEYAGSFLAQEPVQSHTKIKTLAFFVIIVSKAAK